MKTLKNSRGEFANFKLKRRSRAFADDFNRRSNCDLFADLFPGYEGQPTRERRSRGSASDWDYLFNKIKRNSNIFTEPTQCLSEINADEDSPVFSPHPNDNRAPVAIPPPPYQEHSSENQPRTPRKAVEIAIQRRPPLPASPIRHLSPEVSRSPGLKKKPLELKIEHISSPCSSPTCSSTSSPRTPTGPSFVPRPRTDSPLLLHINEDELRDSPPIRRVLHFAEESDENADEPITPTNTNPPTVLHIDDEPSANNNYDDDDDDGSIVIEHRFSEGVSTPTTTIRRRTKGSVSSSSSERSASPASSVTVNHQHTQQQPQVPSSEIKDRRRYTDPSRIVIERTFPSRDSEPDSSKQNRFSTALEFLHDVEPNSSNVNDDQHKAHDKGKLTGKKKLFIFLFTLIDILQLWLPIYIHWNWKVIPYFKILIIYFFTIIFTRKELWIFRILSYFSIISRYTGHLIFFTIYTHIHFWRLIDFNCMLTPLGLFYA